MPPTAEPPGSSARERWNARFRDREPVRNPAAVLTRRAHLLPSGGLALDLAGGTGRNARWLAARGFTVTLVDASDVALEQAAALAAEAGVELDLVRADLSPATVPAGRFDVVVVHHFLDREVWRHLPGRLADGGVLLLCQPTTTNLERHDRPSRRFLLAPGEAASLADELVAADPGLELVERTEGWTDEGRHEATIVLRRRGTS